MLLEYDTIASTEKPADDRCRAVPGWYEKNVSMGKKDKRASSTRTAQPADIAPQLAHRTAGQLFGIFLRILRAQIVVTFGLVLIYMANLGVAPWDMLAIGIANHTPLQYGLALNVVGILVILTDVFMREKIGMATVQDVLLSGVVIDLWTYVFRHAGIADVLLGKGADAASSAGGLRHGLPVIPTPVSTRCASPYSSSAC